MALNTDEDGKLSALVSSIRNNPGWIGSACRCDWWQRTIPPRQSHIRVRIGLTSRLHSRVTSDIPLIYVQEKR